MAGVMELISTMFLGKRQGESSMTNRKVRLSRLNRPARTRLKASPQRSSVVTSKFLYANSRNNWPKAFIETSCATAAGPSTVGLLGSSVFVADALQQLQAGYDDLWKIVDSDDDQ